MITPIFRPDINLGTLADADLRNIDFVRGKLAECVSSLDVRDAEINRLGGVLAGQQTDLSSARDQIVQQSSALAQKDVILNQQKSDLAQRDQRIAELVGANADLRGKLEAATLVPPRISVETLVAQFRTDVEKINHDARLTARGMVVDNLEVEIKGGIDVTKGVCLTQLPAHVLDAQSASTLRFSLKPAATLRMVDDE